MRDYWRPISTAPWDKTVLAYLPWCDLVVMGRMIVDRGIHRGWTARDSVQGAVIRPISEPSMWMPMPIPPSQIPPKRDPLNPYIVGILS